MNKKRRNDISKTICDIEDMKRKIGDPNLRDKISQILSNIESILDDEQEAFDNMPESLKYSFNGMMSEEAIEILENSVDLLSDLSCCDEINNPNDFDEIIDNLSEISM